MRKGIVAVTVLVLVVGCLLIVQQDGAQTKVMPIVSASNGRWQIVNGTPELTHNIMLVDTQTGNSWIICKDGGTDLWCKMERSDLSDGAKQ